MQTHRIPTRRLLTLASILAFMVALLLACGPADESVQQRMGNHTDTAQEGGTDTTPEPTTEPTEEEPAKPDSAGDYPNLDTTLQNVVRQWETTEITEVEAARLAPSYHQRTVLAGITVSWPNEPYIAALAENVEAVDDWMEANGVTVRHADPTERTSLVFGFVPVSKLGQLSQLEYVQSVDSQDPHDDTAQSRMAARSAGASAEPKPAFPVWLKGYRHPDVSTPGKIETSIFFAVQDHEDDILTNDALTDPSTYCVFGMDSSGNHSLDFILADVEYFNDPGAEATIFAYLDEHGIDRPADVPGIIEITDHLRLMGLTMPTSTVRGLSELVAVNRIYTEPCDSDRAPRSSAPGSHNDSDSDGNTGAAAKSASQDGPTERQVGSIRNEAINIHRANDWHGVSYDYAGDGARIGIIDGGFEGLSDELDGELPPGVRVSTYCYAAGSTRVNTSDPSVCETNIDHGQAIAEIIADLAPGAHLYISNAMERLASPSTRSWRRNNALTWMKTNGVQVINHSISGNIFTDGSLGEGIALGSAASALRTANNAVAETSTDKGIVWVNSQGNNGGKTYGGPYTEGASNFTHAFRTDDERMYLNREGLSNRYRGRRHHRCQVAVERQ